MKQNKLKSLTVYQILSQYELPHRFLTYFASQCARDALTQVSNPDPRSLKAVDIAERFGNGEDFSIEELTKARDDAYSAYAAYTAYTSAAYSAASHAASHAAYAAYTTSASDAAYFASRSAHSASTDDKYKGLLINLINKRLTKVQKLLTSLDKEIERDYE